MAIDNIKRWLQIGNKDISAELKKKAEYAGNLDDSVIKAALIGASGVGKSSLLSAIVADETIAKGSTETTAQANSYQCKNHPNLIFVDLPGFGTKNHPQHSYFAANELDKFDYFILVCSERVRAKDVELFKSLQRVGKKVFVVRNKIDLAVESERFDNNLSEAQALKKVQDYVLEQFDGSLAVENLFLTSARNLQKWQFAALLDAIAKALGGIKSDKFRLEANAVNRAQIKKKRRVVDKYISSCAAMSALNALNPIPGLDISIDVKLLMRLADKISHCYNISNSDLARLEQQNPALANSASYRVTKAAIVKMLLTHATKEGVVMVLKKIGKRYAGKMLGKYIPLVGQATSAGLGYYLALQFGNKYRDQAQQYALDIIELTNELSGAA